MFVPCYRSLTVAALLAVTAAGEPIKMDRKAPELIGGPWLNTAEGKPVTMAARRGKVTVVQFWTYLCINCRRNLDAYAAWHRKFLARDILIVGVHTPELEEEAVPENVSRRVKEYGISYPVLLDSRRQNWDRWRQQFWPAIYLVDKRGRVRYRWEGELNYRNAGGEAKMERLIEELAAEPE